MQEPLEELLKAARQSLFLAVKLSKQGSYSRRAPDAESLPHFAEVRRLLEEVLDQSPRNPEALTMMSQVSESLLDYEAAVGFLNEAFEAGEPRTKRALKRLALLRENARAWRDLLLTPEMLCELGRHLEAMGVGPDHRTLNMTRKWLSANVDHPNEVVAALERRGAFSDFQVLANIVHG